MATFTIEEPEFEFEIGDKVQKKKGYIFRGVVVGRYEVEGGVRYDVQVNTLEARQFVLGELYHETGMTKKQRTKVYNFVNNCHGMIHIFAEEQLILDQS